MTDDVELESDGIHLKASFGDRFLAHITQCVSTEVNSLAEVTIVDDEMASDSNDEVAEVAGPSRTDDPLATILRIVQGNSLKLNVVKPLKKSFERLAESSTALETQV